MPILPSSRPGRGIVYGNLVFRKTTRNFSTSMAKAGRITIAEVEHLVRPGELDPDQVHVPGIYVHRIFQGSGYEKRIERRDGDAAAVNGWLGAAMGRAPAGKTLRRTVTLKP